MVDRVYKSRIPALRKALEELRENFSNLRPKTDWTGLRIEPLLRHAESLERLLESREYSREFSRLTRGVEFFMSDLEYFRRNVKGLERILQSERRTSGPKK
jgi:predicted RNase H-like nuclease (RuvC/YqgF family)